MRIENCFISLKGLRFHAFHGVLPQERLTGGDYLINIKVRYPAGKAVGSDHVADTLDYAQLYALVREEMQQPSGLLEHVAGRIGKRLFQKFPKAMEAWIEVTKQNPPMGADCEGASVELHLINDKTVGGLSVSADY